MLQAGKVLLSGFVGHRRVSYCASASIVPSDDMLNIPLQLLTPLAHRPCSPAQVHLHHHQEALPAGSRQRAGQAADPLRGHQRLHHEAQHQGRRRRGAHHQQRAHPHEHEPDPPLLSGVVQGHLGDAPCSAPSAANDCCSAGATAGLCCWLGDGSQHTIVGLQPHRGGTGQHSCQGTSNVLRFLVGTPDPRSIYSFKGSRLHECLALGRMH